MARVTREHTRRQIMQAIKDIASAGKNFTISDVSEKSDLHYYTVREHFQDLIKTHEIEETGLSRGRNVLYKVADKTKTPKLHFDGPEHERRSMRDVAEKLTKYNESRTQAWASLSAIIPLAIGTLYEQAGRQLQSGAVKQQELRELRNNLLTFKANLQNFTMLADEILDSKVLWEPNKLAEVLCNDPTSPMSAETAQIMGRRIQEAWGSVSL